MSASHVRKYPDTEDHVGEGVGAVDQDPKGLHRVAQQVLQRETEEEARGEQDGVVEEQGGWGAPRAGSTR